jgi:hypothetical protein
MFSVTTLVGISITTFLAGTVVGYLFREDMEKYERTRREHKDKTDE